MMAKPSFLFLLAITMVNVQNTGCYFAKLPKVDARRLNKVIILISQACITPHPENSKMQLLSDTRPNTRSGGTAPARLCMLGVTAPALKVSCSVLNVAQLIRLK